MMTQRWATEADIPAIAALMARAIAELAEGLSSTTPRSPPATP